MFLCARGMQMLSSCSDFPDFPNFPDFLRLPSTLFQPGDDDADDDDDDAIVFDFAYYYSLHHMIKSFQFIFFNKIEK